MLRLFALAFATLTWGVTVAGADQCDWVAQGGAPDLDAATCQSDPKSCAVALNQCLQPFDFGKSPNWYLFTADQGLQSQPANPIHINHQTPQHGLFLSVYVNQIAKDALDKLLAMPVAPDKVDLPAGAVIAKLNYNSRQEFKALPQQIQDQTQWLTVMAKVKDFCQPTVGGVCNGGNWFYYLSRFGQFLSFAEVIGVNPDGTPIEGGRTAAFGQPSAFCTDCHNPVERSDWLWTLDAAFWKTDRPVIAVTLPQTGGGVLSPADVCAAGSITLSADLPPDVPINPRDIKSPALAQAMFDCFSWKSFVSLNWPADPDPAHRGQPDHSKPFSDLQAERVWEAYKETFEVFQPSVPGFTPGPWHEEPAIPTACQPVIDTLTQEERRALYVPKILNMPTKTRDNQVLNETHQAFGNQFNILIDQYGRLVRYEVRMNQDEFEYLRSNGYATTGNYSYNGPTNGDQVFFPTNSTGVTGAGAIEVKAAWRQMCGGDRCSEDELLAAKRYYTRMALKYVPAIGDTPAQCHILPAVGLIGLHVIRKTDTAPQWVWSTFEHVDNVPRQGDFPTSGQYTLYNPACETKDRKLTEQICAAMRPGVPPADALKKLAKMMGFTATPEQAACCANLQLLANADPAFVKDAVTVPVPTAPLLRNHITRLDPIGPNTMNANYAAAIRAEDPENPFQNYVLVNTQWPKNARDPNTGAVRRLSCAQTDFVGRDAAPCYDIVPKGLRLRNTSMETFQVSTDGFSSPNPDHFSSAGCINCHGDAGVDFSFVFTDAIEIATPTGGN